jgi:DNA-directed RNA polymerase subunit M/transcription elongation factor TFIIS
LVLRSRYFCGKCGTGNDFLYGTALNYDNHRLFAIPPGWRTPDYVRKDSEEAIRLLTLDDDVAAASYDALAECDELPMKFFYKHEDFVCTECKNIATHFFFFLRKRDGTTFTPIYKCKGCGGRMRLAEAYIREFGEFPKRFRCSGCGDIQPMDDPDEYECVDYRITECLKI